MDGQLPSLGGSPPNPRMVTHQHKDSHPIWPCLAPFDTHWALVAQIWPHLVRVAHIWPHLVIWPRFAPFGFVLLQTLKYSTWKDLEI